MEEVQVVEGVRAVQVMGEVLTVVMGVDFLHLGKQSELLLDLYVRYFVLLDLLYQIGSLYSQIFLTKKTMLKMQKLNFKDLNQLKTTSLQSL